MAINPSVFRNTLDCFAPKVCTTLLALLLLALSSWQTAFASPTQKARQQTPLKTAPNNQKVKRYKILHIMSYHSPWRWTDDQLQGFKDGLGVTAVDYTVFQMNTKHNSTDEAKQSKANEAIKLIEQWQPDLIYTTDDDAQQFVTSQYINTNIPFVFSGVNKSPEMYGYDKSNNITGVVEHEHFIESINLLKGIDPNIKKLAVVFDDATMWPPIQQRIKKGLKTLPNIELIAWDTILTYKDYQEKIKSYQTTVDAIALIGIFNFKDENDVNVPYPKVLKWTAENSTVPDFSFWADRVHHGTLAAVTVSGREQGLAAGHIARAILVDGQKPSDIPFSATAKGVPIINLARAQKMGLKIKSSLLLSSQIIQKFEWD